MSKKYFGSNINVFWTFAEQLPNSHVEDLAPNWFSLNNNIDWKFPEEKLVLISATDYPEYIKCTDGTNAFYFFYIGLGDLIAYKDGKYIYERVYKLDEYMTIFWKMFQDLLQYNPNVQFVSKFYDRFIYTLVDPDADDPVVKTATIDFYQQIQYLKAPREPIAIVRRYIDGSTAESLYARQGGGNWQPLDKPLTWTAWNKIGDTPATDFIMDDPTILFKPNKNNRYTYLVLKSSAKMDAVSVRSHADNTKLIVPIINSTDEPYSKTIDWLMNFNTEREYDCILIAGQGNTVGYFESELPPAVLAGASINGETSIKCECAYMYQDASGHSDPVVFFEVPHNYAFPLQLSTSDRGGISTKLMKIFQNAQTDWSPDTEPLFLTDDYYKEVHSLNQNDRLETAMSLITLTIDGQRLFEEGINVFSHEFFDSTCTSTYFYTNNAGETCTNPQNPIWNSNMSNRTTSLSLASGLYDSASTNYYETNATTQYTSIQNRKSEETQSWLDFGLDSAKSAINNATSFNILNPVKSFGNIATSAISIAEQATNTAMSQARANRSLASQLANIKSSPASTVSNPYVGVCIPNIIHYDDQGAVIGYLFNTYAFEISAFDKLRVFTQITNHGYPTSEVNRLNTFDNRQFCNILHISTEMCSSTLWAFLKNRPRSLFNTQLYNARFISWLNTPHMIYKTNEVRNFFDPSLPDYEPNIENMLPRFPDQAGNIGDLIDAQYIGRYESIDTYTDEQKWEIITRLNPRLISEGGLTFTDFDITNTPNDTGFSRLTMSVSTTSTAPWSGSYTFNYTRPTWTVSKLSTWQMPNLFYTTNNYEEIIDMKQSYSFNNIDLAEVQWQPVIITIDDLSWTETPKTIDNNRWIFPALSNIPHATALMVGTLPQITGHFTDDSGNIDRTIALTVFSDDWRTKFIAYKDGSDNPIFSYGEYLRSHSDGFVRVGPSGDDFSNQASYGCVIGGRDVFSPNNNIVDSIPNSLDQNISTSKDQTYNQVSIQASDAYADTLNALMASSSITVIYAVIVPNGQHHIAIAWDPSQEYKW